MLVTVEAAARLPEALAVLEQHGVDLGPSRGARFRSAARSYKGKERRRRKEASYSGPERREAFL